MMRSVALAAVVLLLGCSEGNGTGAVSGTLFVAQCHSDYGLGTPNAPVPFNLNPGYFLGIPEDDQQHLDQMNRLVIRVQSTGNQLEEADVLYINIADVTPIGQALGQPIPVGPSTNLRATLSLVLTCPQINTQLELDGQIVFSQFGHPPPPGQTQYIEFGDVMAATFEFDIVDRRALTLGGQGAVSSVPQAGGQLSGFFNFPVVQGPAQRL